MELGPGSGNDMAVLLLHNHLLPFILPDRLLACICFGNSATESTYAYPSSLYPRSIARVSARRGMASRPLVGVGVVPGDDRGHDEAPADAHRSRARVSSPSVRGQHSRDTLQSAGCLGQLFDLLHCFEIHFADACACDFSSIPANCSLAQRLSVVWTVCRLTSR